MTNPPGSGATLCTGLTGTRGHSRGGHEGGSVLSKRIAAVSGALLAAGLVSAGGFARPTQAEPIAQAPFVARCVGVYDGDSILVRRAGSSRWFAVRLYGVDAPEYDPPKVQRFGYSSFAFVVDQALYQDVVVRPIVRDLYGRPVAEITLADGRILNEEVLKAGLGWAYRAYLWEPRRTRWLQAEALARQQRIGLWQDANPTPPWIWRDWN